MFIDNFKEKKKMTEKRIIRSYQGYNSKLYNPKADLGEDNSGEVKVDTTGYIPLQELLKRCGIGQHLNMNIDFDVRPGLDKFNDNVDLAQDTLNRLSAVEEQVVQEFVKKKNSVNSQKPQEQQKVAENGTSEKN